MTSAAAPIGVADAPASYGPNVRAWVVYALVFQHIPVARVAELIRDLCGAAPSTGWICGVLRQTAAALVQVKISGPFRSEAGGQAWARIRGYVSTARKHGLTAFAAILAAITGNPWTPTLSPTT